MDWLLPLMLIGSVVWLASQISQKGDDSIDQCPRCGGPMEVTPASLELMRQGWGGGLTTACAACGNSGRLLGDASGDAAW